MSYPDPTTVRLSDSFLLSDFLGCDSVYRFGYPNRFPDSFAGHLAEGRHLAETLETLQEMHGPLGIAYGFISPDLSRRIVTYQDPSKPSYHRWDAGAAADICCHERLLRPDDYAPIEIAAGIDEHAHYSRLITYAESEWLCFATRLGEDPPRKAFYENRYVGVRQPRHIKHTARTKADIHHALAYDWRGQGWPSYHGGGRFQFQHDRLSDYTHVSDFLYSRDKVHQGRRNLPPLTQPHARQRWYTHARAAGRVLDAVMHQTRRRVSVIQAYDADHPNRNWQDRFTLGLAGPAGQHPDDLAELVRACPEVRQVSVRAGRVWVAGEAL